MPASAPRRKPSVPAAPPDLNPDFAALGTERHVALAVSGGSDSVALLRLARDWAAASHPELTLSVLTVDHGLRAESAVEAERVRDWAGNLGLAHHTLRWTPAEKPVTGLQAKARAARYALMADWCRAHGASALLTGHTLDDQAETVLMRLSRTASPDSLAGVRRRGDWGGVPLLRPLLSLRRQALRDHLAGLGQSWIEDPSNADPRFERVRARRSLAMIGEDVTPERLSALGEKSAWASELLARMAATWIRHWLEEEEAGICHVLDRDFRGLPPALQERILARILARYGGGQGEPDAGELRRLASWATGEGGPVRCTLAGAVLGRRKQGFWVTREAARIPPAPLDVPESGKLLWDNRFLIQAAPGAEVGPAAGRPVDLPDGVPVFARRAYPWIAQPPGAAAACISFLRLKTG